MISKISMAYIRIDNNTKLQTQQALVTEQAIPFDTRVLNVKTASALDEADKLIQAKKAHFTNVESLFNDPEKNR